MFLGYMTNESIILHVDLTLSIMAWIGMENMFIPHELFKYYPTMAKLPFSPHRVVLYTMACIDCVLGRV